MVCGVEDADDVAAGGLLGVGDEQQISGPDVEVAPLGRVVGGGLVVVPPDAIDGAVGEGRDVDLAAGSVKLDGADGMQGQMLGVGGEGLTDALVEVVGRVAGVGDVGKLQLDAVAERSQRCSS